MGGRSPHSQTSGGGRSHRPATRGREKFEEARKIAGRVSERVPALIPGRSFSSVLTPRSPRPPIARRLGRSRLRPCGATLRRSHDQPSRRTLILRALGQLPRGEGLMYENAAGLGSVAASSSSPWDVLRRPQRAKGGSGSIPKMLPQAKSPSSGDPRGPTEARPGRSGRPSACAGQLLSPSRPVLPGAFQ